MNIPDAAIEAAATEISGDVIGSAGDVARAAIEAAMPAIREAIAQEIEDTFDAGCEVGHECDKQSGDWNDGHLFAFERAARIVRGGAA